MALRDSGAGEGGSARLATWMMSRRNMPSPTRASARTLRTRGMRSAGVVPVPRAKSTARPRLREAGRHCGPRRSPQPRTAGTGPGLERVEQGRAGPACGSPCQGLWVGRVRTGLQVRPGQAVRQGGGACRTGCGGSFAARASRGLEGIRAERPRRSGRLGVPGGARRAPGVVGPCSMGEQLHFAARARTAAEQGPSAAWAVRARRRPAPRSVGLGVRAPGRGKGLSSLAHRWERARAVAVPGSEGRPPARREGARRRPPMMMKGAGEGRATWRALQQWYRRPGA